MSDGDWDQWQADDPEGVEEFFLGEPDPATFDEADLDGEFGCVLPQEWFAEEDEQDHRPAGGSISPGGSPNRRRPLRSPFVYHVTSIANLQGIVAGSELAAGVARSIGDLQLAQRRANLKVRTSRNRWVEIGSLVGFYFTPRTPMMWDVVKKPFENTPLSEELVLLRAKLVPLALDHEFVFTDGHSLSRQTRSYADLADLGAVDFDLMARRNWDRQTEQRQRQAEFLVAAPVPLRAIDAIGVLNEEVAMRVRRVLAGSMRIVPTPNSFFIPT